MQALLRILFVATILACLGGFAAFAFGLISTMVAASGGTGVPAMPAYAIIGLGVFIGAIVFGALMTALQRL